MKNLKQIEYLEFSQVQKDSITIIIFHGYGSNAQNLSSLSRLKLKTPCRWIVPNGLLKHEESYGIFDGYSWFPLYKDKTGTRKEHKDSIYYLDKHCEQFLEFIESLKLKSDKIILGGFSQGGVMALNLALRMKTPPLALIMMSSILFPEHILNNKKNILFKGGSFFQSHGKQDDVLLYSQSQKIYSFLKSLKWEGEFFSFEGGHDIPPEVLKKIQTYINKKIIIL